MQAPINWNLESIFEGGIEGPSFSKSFERLRQEVERMVQVADALLPLGEDDEAWAKLLLEMDAFEPKLTDCWAYTHCLSCGDTQNRVAARVEASVAEVWGRFVRARVPVEDGLANGSQAHFDALVGREDLQGIREGLKNIRRQGHLLLPRNEQALAEELSQDGIHAWAQLYSRHSGNLEIQVDGEALSSAQVFNRFSGAKDPEERTRVFHAYREAWAEDRDLWAALLTHLTGTRQTLNATRGCGPLDDVLAGARMTRETLDAMHQAISMFRVELLPFLEGKAQLLEIDQLGWQDLWAPISGANVAHSWDDSVQFVLTHFKSAQEPLFLLAKQAFEEGWVEAEDRPHKQAGGWCTSVPKARQSRIFMTHGGSFNSTVTLAHELGHAYHNSVLWEQSSSNRRVPMTLAETASVFAENVVRDAALASASTRGERLAMLDARLRSAVSFLMDIPTRFQFEMGLYDLRAKGELDPDALDALMLSCQQENFCNALREWNPNFWASKLHFFMSRRSFYNFPYSFGYLFSSLVYAMAKREGPGFEARYVRLLQETGWRSAEDIAQDHLGLDLQKAETWLMAMDPIREDLSAFAKMR
jgi:pepF/M3 family oligoendopeptidase